MTNPILFAHNQNVKKFEDEFCDLHPDNSVWGLSIDIIEKELQNKIKSHLTSSTKNILKAVREWAEKNNYEAHVSANGSNYLDGADHDVVSLSDLTTLINSSLKKLA